MKKINIFFVCLTAIIISIISIEIVLASLVNIPDERLEDGYLDIRGDGNYELSMTLSGRVGLNNLLQSSEYQNNIIQIAEYTKDGIKITHEVTNTNIIPMDDVVYWYVIKLPEDPYVYYDREFYNPNLERPIYLHNKNRSVFVFDGEIVLNIRDVLTDYNISEIFMGDGKFLNYDNELIVAVGIDGGKLSGREEVSLDPQLYNASYRYPSINGSISNDFTNAANVFADDGADATITSENKTQSYSNFSLLESEGGQVPDNHGTIFGIGLELEATGSCYGAGGSYNVTAALSWDGGVSWTKNKSNIVGCGTTHPFYGSFILDGVWDNWNHYWVPDELNNSNFKVLLHAHDKIGSPPINDIAILGFDYVRVEAILFTEPNQNNITFHAEPDLPTTNGMIQYHMALTEEDYVINRSNVIIYSPLDWDDPTNFWEIINFDKYSNEGRRSSVKPDYHTDGCISGACLEFEESIFPARKREKILYVQYIQEDYNHLHVDSFTISVWINRTETDVDYNNSVLDSYGTDYELTLVDNGAGTGFYPEIRVTNTSGTTFYCQDNLAWNNDEWYHLVATYDSSDSRGRIYKNTAIAETCFDMMDNNYDLQKDATAISVGARENGFTDRDYFIGRLDEILFLEGVLNGTEVTRLYNSYGHLTYDTGYLEFPSLNIYGNDSINLSSVVTVLDGASLNVSIGDLDGDGYNWSEQYDYDSGAITNLTTCTPNNFSLRFYFEGAEVSPYMNASTDSLEPYNLIAWSQSVECDDCGYTSGNWDINCSVCPGLTENVQLDSGANATFYNQGVFNFNGFNLTMDTRPMIRNSCRLRVSPEGGLLL